MFNIHNIRKLLILLLWLIMLWTIYENELQNKKVELLNNNIVKNGHIF